MLVFSFHQTKQKAKKTQKKHEKTSLRKNTIKTNKISTFAPAWSVPMQEGPSQLGQAGDLVFISGTGMLRALAAPSGEETWSLRMD